MTNSLKKFRINMIIGKKQIIIAGLTLLLGIAVYVNYIYSSARNDLTDSSAINSNSASANSASSYEASGGSSYGDAVFVNGSNVSDDDVAVYFAEARLAKRESRDEAKEFLQSMANGGDAVSEELQVIAQDASDLGGFIESETKIESILKAQGFSDVLCYISDRGANIIVRADGLTAQDAAKIKDALLSEVDVAAENITILEIK